MASAQPARNAVWLALVAFRRSTEVVEEHAARRVGSGEIGGSRGSGPGTIGPAYRLLVMASALATFTLVVLGGVVRVSGAGLACPDWPLCQGRLIPPLQGLVIIEYSHRLLASLVSILVIAVGVASVALYRRRPVVLVLALAAVALLAVQVVLGGVTVLLELPPTIVTAHLGIAEALLGVLVALYLVTRPAPAAASATTMGARSHARFRRLALSAVIAVYALMLAGAYVRGAGATLACGAQWPLCAGGLLPPGQPALVHMVHRFLSLAVGLHVLFTAWRGWRLGVPAIAGVSGLIVALFAGQVLAGAANPWTAGAPWAQALHLALASALWASVVALAALAWRAPLPPSAQPPSPAGGEGRPGLGRMLADYLTLTKPGVVALLLLTAVGGAVLAARGMPSGEVLAAVLIGGAMAAGGAGALNHYLERDLDSAMTRTRRRPLPGHRVPPGHALFLGLGLNLGAFLVFVALTNLLSAALALAGALLYLLVYTRWLKRSTPQNIVIGGAAGAIPPLVGWAAVTGRVDLPALYLFGIIFFWTPPHFWALALLLREDYARAGVPMLPVVQGEQATAWQILLYSLVLVALTALLFTTSQVGWLYLGLAVALDGLFLFCVVQLLRDIRPARARRLYWYSLLYLALIFAAVMVDSSLSA